ncbi:HAD-IIIA family hydrolase [Labedaea rhizosphaerae]|uniref:D,D-heptose 1,7-bisphosphate phosphatase n=1 Tax=Labedaea rhizosphaerae TaxID=598644 RepID=A0A4R6SIE2_LABRH|nr:HAD-IIIA family hydrolase [Labedaea rhizosphaerae]TDQ00738.1 HAD superfamily hydrolase (TIGR01509 family)/HAD superfamily hydrolase (TIGR01549 family) [Labedaea rhizosphaerae]
MNTPRAILFDRDGTLVVEVPDNPDPTAVRTMPGALAALDAARSRKIHIGVLSNQPGIALGSLTEAAGHAVDAQVERLLGPFDTWQVCPHAPADGCSCRKPKPGLVLAACRELGVEPRHTFVIGDTAADVEAARAAGAVGILVPTLSTARAEVEAASWVETTLVDAVHSVIDATREDLTPSVQ